MSEYKIILKRPSINGDEISACVVAKDNKRCIVAVNLLSQNPRRTEEVSLDWFYSSLLNVGFVSCKASDLNAEFVKKILKLPVIDLGYPIDFKSKLYSIREYNAMSEKDKKLAIFVEDEQGNVIFQKFRIDHS